MDRVSRGPTSAGFQVGVISRDPPGADSREEGEPQAGACVYPASACTVASGWLRPWLQASAQLLLICSMVSPLGLSHSPPFRPFGG